MAPIQYPSGRRPPRFGGLVDGTLYVTDGGTDVIAVNAADGTIRWRRNLYDRVTDSVPEKFLSPSDSAAGFSPLPVATLEIVYVQSSYGVHGLAPGDGAKQWRLYLGDQTDEPALEDPYGLAVTDRRVWESYGGYVQSLFTIGLSDGSPEIEPARLPLGFPSNLVVTAFVLAFAQTLVLGIVGVAGAWVVLIAVGAEFTLSVGPVIYVPYIVPLSVALWAALVATVVYLAYPETALSEQA